MESIDRVQFRPRPDVAAAIAARRHGSERVGETVQWMLRAYLELVRQGEREIQNAGFTPREGLCIVDACNGLIIDPHTAHLVVAEVKDAIRMDHLDKKWGVSGEALIEKMEGLSRLGRFALGDLIRRFFATPTPTIREPLERLREVGFPLTEEEV